MTDLGADPDALLIEPGQTIADALRRTLRQDIVGGRLAPGAPLRTQVLCEEYRCSLAPLREALSGLAAEGLVVAAQQRGFRVASIGRAEWSDLIERRVEIETRMLALSIRHGDDAWESDVVRCEHEFRLISQRILKRRGRIDETWEARHRAFHLSLVAGCGSPWLMRFCHSLYDHSDRYRRLARIEPGAMGELDAGEHELAQATLARDRPLAQRLLREHIEAIGNAVLASERLWALAEFDVNTPTASAARAAR